MPESTNQGFGLLVIAALDVEAITANLVGGFLPR